MRRGEIWWAGLAMPRGNEPGFARPVLIVQSDAFNRSRIGTVVVVALTSNLARAEAPGNVRIAKGTGGVPKRSVANVAHVMTLDRADLTQRLGQLGPAIMREVDAGLRTALGLDAPA